ncbi:MAG: hypothetical protein K2P14_01850 [Anaeroplasmataceae bacterium]|nr:hypothetical protein [Anaeroplasmataceae bacterium]
MKGKHRVEVKFSNLHYVLELKRKYTIILGDTGSGKTSLYSLLVEKLRLNSRLVKIHSDVNIGLGNNLYDVKEHGNDYGVMFLEEGNYLTSKEMDTFTRSSSSYFVIFSRYPLKNLSYSINEIYVIDEVYSGKKRRKYLKPYYDLSSSLTFRPDIIVTEDKKSGNIFFSKTQTKDTQVLSACGKDNVLTFVRKLMSDKDNILVVADGAACGGNSDEFQSLIDYASMYNKKLAIFTPESFEFILLSSSIFDDADIRDKLERTYLYADSLEFLTWERYYTWLIKQLIRENGYLDIGMGYKKSKLPKYFIINSDCVYDVIRKLIPTERKFL